jgi:zinc finger CCCH domain-containing protein 13
MSPLRELVVTCCTSDAPTRPSFRSSLSQPSQMGNFRHQSLRTADRERDSERERQREERDREGQERLRNVKSTFCITGLL